MSSVPSEITPATVAAQFEQLRYELKRVIVGQDHLLECLLIALLVEGHVLLEGAPGLAKTLALKSLAEVLTLAFKRIQFTPDLLPSDLIGTRIFHPASSAFTTEKGPIFAHLILADEINRAPAKVQSALLEAMQERQVTIGCETFVLEAPFLVMATQNPIESEGTYPLPEAQLDRFLMKVCVPYPSAEEEQVILQRGIQQPPAPLVPQLGHTDLLAVQQAVKQVYLDPQWQQQIVTWVQATRQEPLFQFGASPRGVLAIARSAQARALLRGRDYVTGEDLDAVALDCLRHRVSLTYAAMVPDIGVAVPTVDSVLMALLERCRVS